MSKLQVTIDDKTFEVTLDLPPQMSAPIPALVDGEPIEVVMPKPTLPTNTLEWIIVDGYPYELVFDEDLCWLKSYFGIHRVEIRDLEAVVARPRSGDGRVKAPIPGLITRLLISVGDKVTIGQPLLVLEAMKMENEVRAARTGAVESVHVSPGQSVTRNEVLAEIV